jgi:protein-tyrosine phosphatase
MSSSWPPAAFVTEPTNRRLRWDGCWNVRDLGGLPVDGGATRLGAIVRADDISQLSPAGWDSLVAYGVRRIVDLRHEDPPYQAPVEVVRVPLVEDGAFAEIDELLAGVDDPVEWRRRNYRWFLEHRLEAFGRAVTAVAAGSDGVVVVHCAGGVDRTGLVVALLLRIAGVAVEAVTADYVESEANWAPLVGEWIDGAHSTDERTKRRFLSIMPPAAMRDTLRWLDRERGGVREYLVEAGVARNDLDRVRQRLRG